MSREEQRMKLYCDIYIQDKGQATRAVRDFDTMFPPKEVKQEEPELSNNIFKVIGNSNHDKESESDFLVCEKVVQHYGEKIRAHLQYLVGEKSPIYYKVVPMDYKLYVFDPNS